MKDLSKYKDLGNIKDNIARICGFPNTNKVYVAPGLIKHVKKHVSDMSDREKEDIYTTIQNIFDSPDYIGADPKKIGQAIEIVKVIDNNLLLAIEIDQENDYNYVSSLYPIKNVKLQNRLTARRLKSIKDIANINESQQVAEDEVAATK